MQVDNFVPHHYYFITIVWSWKAIISKRIATWWQTYRWKVIVVSKCYAVGRYRTRTHARTRALPETRWWHWLSAALMRVISDRYTGKSAPPLLVAFLAPSRQDHGRSESWYTFRYFLCPLQLYRVLSHHLEVWVCEQKWLTCSNLLGTASTVGDLLTSFGSMEILITINYTNYVLSPYSLNTN